MTMQWELPFETRKTRADQIFEAFVVFHRENPVVWELFQRFALDLIKRGRENYSSNAIFERIRWHVDIETTGPELTLPNNYRAYYARLFHAAYPQHSKFFRNCKRRSEDQPANPQDPQGCPSPPAGIERDLNNRLDQLLRETPCQMSP